MSVTQKDYLVRQLEAFVEALRQIIELKSRGQPLESLDLLQETAEQIFGASLALVDSVDAASAADILVEPEKIEMYARLAEEESELLAALGRHEEAAARRERALEMYIERTGLPPPVDAKIEKRIRKLRSMMGG